MSSGARPSALFAARRADKRYPLFVPGRFPDVYDWIADVIGAGLGTWGMFHWLKRRRRGA